MAVSMGLRNRLTGEYQEVPIATLASFREVWLPICERLGLVWIPEFAGGALTVVPEQLIQEIVRELQALAHDIGDTPNLRWIAERAEAILAAFAKTTPTEWEYDFG
jgi:hypothetical protein